MKKIVSLLIVLTMLIGILPAFAAANTYDDQRLANEQKVLKALGLMSADSYGVLDNSQEITRVEFASTVGKIVDINPTISADSTYYADVAADSWAAHTLNTLVDMGVLSVPEDKIFRPNDVITYNEAVKIFVSLLGYSDYALRNGGYPGGYIAAANRIKLLDGVARSENVTTGVLTTLLYNAIHCKMLDVEKIGKTVGYTNKNETTLLSLYRNIYFDDGIVEAVNGLSVTGKAVGANKCLINGTVYNVGSLAVEGKLGYAVTLYYEDVNDGTKTLICLDDTDTDVLTISAEDFIGYESGKIKYYNDSDKEKSAKTDSSATVVRNGSVVSSGLSEAFKLTEGELRLIDNDSDGSYDIVFIEDYQTAVVKSVNTTEKNIVDDVDVKNVIDLSKIDDESIWVYGADGTLLGFDAIVPGSVIDAAVSADSAVIYVSSNVFEGTVDSVSLKDKKMIIDGTEYEYLDSSYKRFSVDIGKKGTFKTNRYGKIAYFSETKSSFVGGYLIDVSDKANGLDSSVKLKMLATDGEIKILEIADKVTIDGEQVRKNVAATLASAKKNVVMYILNSKGQVCEIDTPAVGANEDDATLHLMGTTDGVTLNQRYCLEEKKFGKKFYLSSDVVMFRVPVSGEGDDDEYGIELPANLASNRGYETAIYKTGHSAECNFVAIKRTAYPIDDYASYYWVKEVRKGVDSDGNKVTKVIVYDKGSEKTINIVDGYSIIPNKGDVIRAGLNAKGVSGLIEIHYDYKTRKTGRIDPASDWAGYDTVNYWYKFQDLMAYNRIAIVNAVTLNGDLLGVTREAKGSEEIEEYFKVTSTTPIVVYDAEDDKFYQGSVGDIRPSDAYGTNCSELIVFMRYNKPIAVWVMNNRAD